MSCLLLLPPIKRRHSHLNHNHLIVKRPAGLLAGCDCRFFLSWWSLLNLIFTLQLYWQHSHFLATNRKAYRVYIVSSHSCRRSLVVVCPRYAWLKRKWLTIACWSTVLVHRISSPRIRVVVVVSNFLLLLQFIWYSLERIDLFSFSVQTVRCAR